MFLDMEVGVCGYGYGYGMGYGNGCLKPYGCVTRKDVQEGVTWNAEALAAQDAPA